MRKGGASKEAAVLGLSDQVQRETFEALLDGYLPSGQRIGIQKDGQWKHREGWDLTFSASKSVFILALCRDKRLVELHNKAVTATMVEIERIGAQARVWKEGQIYYENNSSNHLGQSHGNSRVCWHR